MGLGLLRFLDSIAIVVGCMQQFCKSLLVSVYHHKYDTYVKDLLQTFFV